MEMVQWNAGMREQRAIRNKQARMRPPTSSNLSPSVFLSCNGSYLSTLLIPASSSEVKINLRGTQNVVLFLLLQWHKKERGVFCEILVCGYVSVSLCCSRVFKGRKGSVVGFLRDMSVLALRDTFFYLFFCFSIVSDQIQLRDVLVYMFFVVLAFTTCISQPNQRKAKETKPKKTQRN